VENRALVAGAPAATAGFVMQRCLGSTPTVPPSPSSPITLQNEGWERDVNVVEPQEP